MVEDFDLDLKSLIAMITLEKKKLGKKRLAAIKNENIRCLAHYKALEKKSTSQ